MKQEACRQCGPNLQLLKGLTFSELGPECVWESGINCSFHWYFNKMHPRWWKHKTAGRTGSICKGRGKDCIKPAESVIQARAENSHITSKNFTLQFWFILSSISMQREYEKIIKLMKWYYLYQKISIYLISIFLSYCNGDVQVPLRNSDLLILQNAWALPFWISPWVRYDMPKAHRPLFSEHSTARD